jgi:hypothetical protein
MSEVPIFENEIFVDSFSISTLRLAIRLTAAKDEHGYVFWEEYRYANGNKFYMFGLSDDGGDGDLLFSPSRGSTCFRDNQTNYNIYVKSRMCSADLSYPLQEMDTTPLIDRALDTCEKLKANLATVNKLRWELDNESKTDEELFDMLFPEMGATSDL